MGIEARNGYFSTEAKNEIRIQTPGYIYICGNHGFRYTTVCIERLVRKDFGIWNCCNLPVGGQQFRAAKSDMDDFTVSVTDSDTVAGLKRHVCHNNQPAHQILDQIL